jgi:hypothetical protein
MDTKDNYVLGSQLSMSFSKTGLPEEFMKNLNSKNVYSLFNENQLRIIWYAMNNSYIEGLDEKNKYA